MDITQEQLTEMLAHEAFIRRASALGAPFMLKGSYVTRQFFHDPTDRLPADVDWVYLNQLTDEPRAVSTFNAWMTQVTELACRDGVDFTSFADNAFWRMIDYAMADDFPTVNTDVECQVDGESVGFGLDVSFNLTMDDTPVPLTYFPLRGDPFLVPHSVPLSLQVAWKIHQTLVRPRFKDLFDLMHLVQHYTFTDTTRQTALQALVNECRVDNVSLDKLRLFLAYDLGGLFPEKTLGDAWDYWRHNVNKSNYRRNLLYDDQADNLTDASKLPARLDDFVALFAEPMKAAGFTASLMTTLPAPNRVTRTTYHKTLPLPPAGSPGASSGKDGQPSSFLQLIKRLLK